MKKITAPILAGIAGLFLLAFTAPAFADDSVQTINGDAKCAKCMLHETDHCQTVIQAAAKDGKNVTYWLVANDVSKSFHKDVCSEAKKVTATGTVAEKDGKMMLTATKIEVAKD